jgi:NADH:ubiquinone oxidoreductase subunit 4 (subunit M)
MGILNNFIIIPILGLIFSVLWSEKREKIIANTAMFTLALQLLIFPFVLVKAQRSEIFIN